MHYSKDSRSFWYESIKIMDDNQHFKNISLFMMTVYQNTVIITMSQLPFPVSMSKTVLTNKYPLDHSTKKEKKEDKWQNTQLAPSS